MTEKRKFGRSAFVTPVALSGGIAAVALVLIFQITLRPWAGADSGTDTHLNMSDPMSDYTRSELAVVGAPEIAPIGWVRSGDGQESDDTGLTGYVAYGCASCHGLAGEGTASGPPVVGSSLRRTGTLSRKGPGGMPVYDDVHLVDADLDAIAAYITGLPEIPEVADPVPQPAATPFPTATPLPTATPVPTPTPQPTPTPLPPDAPTPTPGPTSTPAPAPTPEPTPDPGLVAAARQLYIDVGCDLCHGVGAEGGDDGPAIEDATAKEIEDSVRDPQRDPDSIYPKGMTEYLLTDLSEAELIDIIFYLRNLPGE
ncbi:MAG: c-type cytochrome [Dehalococcoidia bacterium]|jgi:mono/diheme cytochrome c family protein|nr:c-type cytochrome [Dehalococcoidia bacterium]